jgi:hypothetical protein
VLAICGLVAGALTVSACGSTAIPSSVAAVSPSIGPSQPGPTAAVPPTAVGRAAPTARPLPHHVAAEWTVNNPSGLYIAFGSVWVPGHHDLTTTRIDPATNSVVAVVKGTGDHAEQALAVGDVLWITGQADDTTWVDPMTNTVTATMPRVPGFHHYLADGFNSVWITTTDSKLDRIDPATGRIIASIPYLDRPADCNGLVDATAKALWVEVCDSSELVKIDPATNTVASRTAYAALIAQAKAKKSLPAGKGTASLWISTAGGDVPEGLLRVDPATGTGTAFLPLVPDQSGDGSVTVTDTAIWVGGSGQINRVDIATNKITATYPTDPGSIIHLAVGFGSVWLENYDRNLVQRLDVAP